MNHPEDDSRRFTSIYINTSTYRYIHIIVYIYMSILCISTNIYIDMKVRNIRRPNFYRTPLAIDPYS